MNHARFLSAPIFALAILLGISAAGDAQAEDIAAEDLISGGTHSHLLIQSPATIEPDQIGVTPIPLPSTVAMGLLGLTVCAAGVCRRRGKQRNRRP